MSAAQLGRPHASTAPGDGPRAKRGTSNRDARGNTKNRRARRHFFTSSWRADVDLVAAFYDDGSVRVQASPFTPDPGCGMWVGCITRLDDHRRARGVTGLLAEDPLLLDHVEVIPATRCYRCGCLLHAGLEQTEQHGELEGTVTADRIIPGGSYRRDNIRPCCGSCNETTGGRLGVARKAAKKKPKP